MRPSSTSTSTTRQAHDGKQLVGLARQRPIRGQAHLAVCCGDGRGHWHSRRQYELGLDEAHFFSEAESGNRGGGGLSGLLWWLLRRWSCPWRRHVWLLRSVLRRRRRLSYHTAGRVRPRPIIIRRWRLRLLLLSVVVLRRWWWRALHLLWRRGTWWRLLLRPLQHHHRRRLRRRLVTIGRVPTTTIRGHKLWRGWRLRCTAFRTATTATTTIAACSSSCGVTRSVPRHQHHLTCRRRPRRRLLDHGLIVLLPTAPWPIP